MVTPLFLCFDAPYYTPHTWRVVWGVSRPVPSPLWGVSIYQDVCLSVHVTFLDRWFFVKTLQLSILSSHSLVRGQAMEFKNNWSGRSISGWKNPSPPPARTWKNPSPPPARTRKKPSPPLLGPEKILRPPSKNTKYSKSWMITYHPCGIFGTFP